MLDGSQQVRTHLLPLLQLLPKNSIADRVQATLLYVRAGMTNLATSIRDDALSILSYLLEIAAEEIITCPGGWVKTLKCFMSMMGWTSLTGPSTNTATKKSGWSSVPKSNLTLGSSSASDLPRQLLILSQFLKAGLHDNRLSEDDLFQVVQQQQAADFPLYDRQAHMMPTKANAYAHLNLFGAPRDEDGEIYMDRESRQRVFEKRFRKDVEKGAELAKKAGGEVGRAGSVLSKVLREGMDGFELGVDIWDLL